MLVSENPVQIESIANACSPIIAVSVISIVAHFAVGALTSFIAIRPWWASGLEMTMVGVIEAAVTYGLGLAFGAIN